MASIDSMQSSDMASSMDQIKKDIALALEQMRESLAFLHGICFCLAFIQFIESSTQLFHGSFRAALNAALQNNNEAALLVGTAVGAFFIPLCALIAKNIFLSTTVAIAQWLASGGLLISRGHKSVVSWEWGGLLLCGLGVLGLTIVYAINWRRYQDLTALQRRIDKNEAVPETQEPRVLIICPSCRQKIAALSGKAGNIRCPSCHTLFYTDTR